MVVNPLLPAGQWKYFAIDGLPYHGHLLTILWDADGKRYRRARGMLLMVDGKRLPREKIWESWTGICKMYWTKFYGDRVPPPDTN